MLQEAPFDDATLHAHVDGQLSAEDDAQVAAWLQGHPHEQARVERWRTQALQLRALQADLLREPLPARLTAALRPEVGLRQRMPGGVPAAVPAFVRDAAVAHAVYTPERRHPVEVGAQEQAHLVQWLSKRLGTPLKAPVLTGQGYTLVGGRLLPASEGLPAGGAASDVPLTRLARAQFMYEAADGVRLTLYISVSESLHGLPTGFKLVRGGRGVAARNSFYWVDGQVGYALTAPLPAEALHVLARQVYQQLQP